MTKLRIAVIGADRLDPDHHLALNDFSERGRVEAFAFEAEPDAAGFESLRQVMQHQHLDAIILACPPGELRAWACFALENGWPVYVTHPVTLTIEDMVEIRRQEQIADRAILQFALTARLQEAAQEALAKAETGEYGRLLSLRGVCGVATPDDDELPLFSVGAQLIDLMQVFAGPFQDVSGFADFDRGPEAGTESNIVATLRTHVGTLANLHLSTTQWRPTFRLELGYERGYMWLEGQNTQLHPFGQEVLVYARTEGNGARHETVDRFEQSQGARASLDAFMSRLIDPAQPSVGQSQDAFDALNTLQRILAADPIFAPMQERHVS